MARAPRASVSKTSGQGVSRLSYQKGYALGNKGKATSGVKDAPPVDKVRAASGRGKAKLGKAGDMNVGYGDLINPGSLVDVESYAKDKPAKGFSLTPKKAKKLK